MPRKVARQQLRLRHHLTHLLHVLIQPRAMRRPAAENRRARWIARGRRAVGIREKHPTLRQPVKVRRLRLRMSAQAADPVIEIVHRDEEDVWRCGQGLAARERKERKKSRNELHSKDGDPSNTPRLGEIVGGRRANRHSRKTGLTWPLRFELSGFFGQLPRGQVLPLNDVHQVLIDGPHVLLKQLRHQRLRQPNELPLKAALNTRLPVLGLVEEWRMEVKRVIHRRFNQHDYHASIRQMTSFSLGSPVVIILPEGVIVATLG